MAIENVNIIDERRPKIVRNRLLIAISRPTGDHRQSKTLAVAISDPRSSIVKRVYDCRISGIETNFFFFQQKYEKCIKLFIVTLVSDCSAYVFSRPIFNKHFRYAEIENVYTMDKRRSMIVRNRVIDCRL